jgi:large conductance mechanosensitive channel
MEKENQMKKRVKGFFAEFKKFITRGNVLDMAVGVIVGGAFTAIVNALSNNILRPVINALLALILGKDSLSGIYTFLQTSYVKDESGVSTGVINLAESIYIDWGAFINAIINFILIAFVLFMIVRIINRISEANQQMKKDMQTEKEALKKYKKEGLKKKEAIARYRADLAEEKARIEKEEAEKKAEEERLALEKELANTRLLEEIRDLLKNRG